MQKVAEDSYRKYLEIMLKRKACEEPEKKEMINDLIEKIPTAFKIVPIDKNGSSEGRLLRDNEGSVSQ